jgi:hypothetical protein
MWLVTASQQMEWVGKNQTPASKPSLLGFIDSQEAVTLQSAGLFLGLRLQVHNKEHRRG